MNKYKLIVLITYLSSAVYHRLPPSALRHESILSSAASTSRRAHYYPRASGCLLVPTSAVVVTIHHPTLAIAFIVTSLHQRPLVPSASGAFLLLAPR